MATDQSHAARKTMRLSMWLSQNNNSKLGAWKSNQLDVDEKSLRPKNVVNISITKRARA